jgi:hypothetical protein
VKKIKNRLESEDSLQDCKKTTILAYCCRCYSNNGKITIKQAMANELQARLEISKSPN